jgi:hypothetical protein
MNIRNFAKAKALKFANAHLRNFTAHNCLGHPLMGICDKIGYELRDRFNAQDLAYKVIQIGEIAHNFTLPPKPGKSHMMHGGHEVE